MFTLQQVLTSLHIDYVFDSDKREYHIKGLPENNSIVIYIETNYWRDPGIKYYFVNQYHTNGSCMLQEGTKSIHQLLINLGVALYKSYIK